MAKQTFTTGQVLTAAQMTSLQANDYNWTVSAQTGSYVLVAANAGQHVTMNAAGATTITVNTAIFTAGDTIRITNIGAGTCTITAGTATVTTAGTLALIQWASGILYFTSAGAAIFFPDSVKSKIAQVVTTAKTDTFTTTSATFTDVTGMSVSITPTLSTSQILVLVQGNAGNNSAANGCFFGLVRTATQIDLGDAALTRARVSAQTYSPGDSRMVNFGLTFLDSPATTSATTYKLQTRVDLAGTMYLNRSFNDSDLTSNGRAASTITVMEVLA